MNNITQLTPDRHTPTGRFEQALVALYYDGLLCVDSTIDDLDRGDYWLRLLDDTTAKVSFTLTADGPQDHCQWTRWMGRAGEVVLEDSGPAHCTALDAVTWLTALVGTPAGTQLPRPPSAS